MKISPVLLTFAATAVLGVSVAEVPTDDPFIWLEQVRSERAMQWVEGENAKDFSYRNSPHAIRRFPLPFPEDSYMYSVNIEPHLPGPPGWVVEFAFDIDET